MRKLYVSTLLCLLSLPTSAGVLNAQALPARELAPVLAPLAEAPPLAGWPFSRVQQSDTGCTATLDCPFFGDTVTCTGSTPTSCGVFCAEVKCDGVTVHCTEPCCMLTNVCIDNVTEQTCVNYKRDNCRPGADNVFCSPSCPAT